MIYKKSVKLLILLAALFASANLFAQKLKVTDMVCEYQHNPDLIDAANPRLSWKLESEERDVLQTAYEIRVGTTAKAVGSWVTGKVNSDQSILVAYSGAALLSGQKYYWQVRVWDNHGHVSDWSAVQSWQMGLLNKSDWQARWIQLAQPTDGKVCPAPIFRKGFKLAGKVKNARLYITSLGLYEANINGKKVGDRYFTPGWTSYGKRLQYQAYDVTDIIKPDGNVAAVTVGDGWYRGNLAFLRQRNLYGKEVGLLFQLIVEHTNGTKEIIASDESWKSSADGPIRASDIYNGETYDARLAQNNWLPSYDDSKWQSVKLMEPYAGQLIVSPSPAVRKHEVFKPVKIFTAPNGETIVDFGQNLVGWTQLKVKGNTGDSIIIRHAEVLDKTGNFYIDNLRGAQETNRFVLKGGKVELLEPHFTFQGFRYAAIKGLNAPLNPADISGIAIYSDMPLTGNFSSSNTLINQLQHNITWGQKGNFLDVPTDCPQRDERLGWTGDAQVFFNTAAFNRDVAGFFTKWLGDLKDDQFDSGNVPSVIPNVLGKSAGTAGWADVATIIPWNFYVAYGDKKLLADQYDSMKAWVNFMKKNSTDNVCTVPSSYGDWLFYSPDDDRSGKAAITDRSLITQSFYAYSTQLLINAATVLDNKNDADYYSALLVKIKEAFLREFVTPSGRLISNTQTAYVLALNFDLLPESLRAQAAKRLADNVKEYNNHLTTGFIGTPYLCHVLSRFGYIDVAYKLLMQDTYPSWLYPVKMGATTIWERWDGIKPNGTFENISMNSFNHYAYGAIGDWMYRVSAGINQDTLGAAYKQIIIAPKPGGGLTTATAELETGYGKVRSSWKLDGKVFDMEVTIPPNTTAKVILPDASGAIVTENNIELSKSGLSNGLTKQGNDIQLRLGSGTYHFSYVSNKKIDN